MKKSSCALIVMLLAGMTFGLGQTARGQVNPLDFVTITQITDNNAATNELGRDRASINSTAFKNESFVTAGDYQFTTYYRDDGKLLVARRDLTAPTNDWDIRVTEFTSYNINDAHNVPVLGIDGTGYLHLAWGTHGNPLLYSKTNTPVAAGQAMSFVGDTVGNSAAPNTMTGNDETGTTYPNFVRIPGSDDLLFNYRTGGSGNGTYRLTHYDDSTDTWSWQDRVWIKNTDSPWPWGITYNAYPHNLSYDSNGGLHASWTYRYNSSSSVASGYQTNHNLHYAYSPDDGATWYKDLAGTIPYPTDIDESNSQVIVNIPENSSLINTGTQAIDANDRPAIATWWAPHAHDADPDHRRQYMYVGNDGNDWFTSQITHRRSEPNIRIPESQLGTYPMQRPQIVFDDYNRAFVIYRDHDNGFGVTVAYSQAESRNDWEFIKLTADDFGTNELTIDRSLWERDRQLHVFVQDLDGNSNNGGSPVSIVQWDAASALGNVLKWTAASSSTWNTTTQNFTDLGTATMFQDFDNVTFDDTGASQNVTLPSSISAGKVVVDSSQAYTFGGPGSLVAGSLSVVGGGSLDLATSGNSYAGPTRVSNATLKITGDATAMTSKMIAAAGGTLVMDSSDASTMTSEFEIWPTGVLEIGSATTTGNPFPENPTSIINDGLIRVKTNETLKNVQGLGTIEAAAGTTTLQSNPTFQGGVRVKAGATAISVGTDGLGTGQSGEVTVEDGGLLRISTSATLFQYFNISGEGGGAGAVQIAASADVTFADSMTVNGVSTALDTGAGAIASVEQGVAGAGGLTKQGAGTLHLKGDNTYNGRTVVRDGLLIVDQSTGFGATIVDPGGVLEARGAVRGDLSALSGSLVRINSSVPAFNGVLFQDDFSGTGGPLDGTTPDTSLTGDSWVAAATFEDDGDSVAGPWGGSATLAFTPVDGSIYTLEASLENITGDSDWFAVGFASGQSTANSSAARFITGDVEGLAWALYRGDASNATNVRFLGDTSVEPDSGLASGAADWLVDANTGGGSVDLRITLDTTGGDGNWTVTMEADTGSGFQTISATEALLDEAINSVGIANSNTADLTGTITSFSLTTDVPSQDPLSTRTLTVEGDFNLNLGATVEMTLFDTTNHDVLDVLGSLEVAGTLVVALDDGGPSPQLNDTFDILDFGSAAGVFEAISLPALSAGLFWDTSKLLTTGALTVVDTLPGDFDTDGDVDGLDFLVWQRNPAVGDLADWQANYGTSASLAAASSAVPEPSTLGLAASIFCAVVLGRRNTNHRYLEKC